MAQATATRVTDNYAWAARVLTLAGLPPTPNNVGKIVRWIQGENNTAAGAPWYQRNNPLNISPGGNLATYPNLEAGAQATAQTLRNGYYDAVVNNLAANGPLDQFSAAVVSSPWAGGHYGGNPLYFAQMGKPPKYSVTGQELAKGTPGVDQGTYMGKGLGCDPGGGISFLGAHAFTGCQVKAITGGLMVGAGGVLLLAGLVLVAGQTALLSRTGNQLLGAVGASRGGAAGKALETVTSEPEAPAPPKAPSMAEQRRQAQAAKAEQARRDEAERDALWAQMDAAARPSGRGSPPRPRPESTPPRRPTPTRPKGTANPAPARKRRAA